ncbi:MAG: hypothetical protein M1832_004581 [Thelocarpon impressellum]|nr:MAG: hypothetical protein M1832_004581 [Thelocarpon impressellum]
MPASALLTAVDSTAHVHLVVGANLLAAARCSRSLDVGARPVLAARGDAELHHGLRARIDEGRVAWLRRPFRDADLCELGRAEVDGVVDAVFVTLGAKDALSAHISTLCRRLRVPVNVCDAPGLCTFTLLSTHSDGPLHVGITTSGNGCKLASRIRREIASSLPADLGAACERLGSLRRRIAEDQAAETPSEAEAAEGDGGQDDGGQDSSFNRLVTAEDRDAAHGRRMRWLGQICEYWPLSRLAAISDTDVDDILRSYSQSSPAAIAADADQRTRRGRIILAGSGPGHPDLLTRATHKAILAADVVLADKLVPAPVLALVPRRTPVHIARKFPGNADKAQEELLALALAGLRAGQVVVRLKQGDPYLYGRGGEEHAFFRAHGYDAAVLPGITSALSAPLFARVPATHRAVADQVLVCTGTGRKGAVPAPPPYNAAQTVVFLMALHRLPGLVSSLISSSAAAASVPAWPESTPCAVVERASCADQRVIRSTLAHVAAAVEEVGSRPPGLLVVGAACGVLCADAGAGAGAGTGAGAGAGAGVAAGAERWVVEEGFRGLDGLDGLGADVPLRAPPGGV